MEFTWTTFFLEIANFLVLVWILKRFLYKPVQAVIDQRKANVERFLSTARSAQEHADALKTRYEKRLEDWEHEKEAGRAQLVEELAAERSRSMQELLSSLEQEREKARAVEARRQDELARQVEVEALAHSTEFASRLLARMAAPELEARILEIVTQDLADLSAEQRATIGRALREAHAPIAVTSAFGLDETQRGVIARALSALAGTEVAPHFAQDPALVAGLSITAGAYVLRANLCDQLQFFAEAGRGGA